MERVSKVLDMMKTYSTELLNNNNNNSSVKNGKTLWELLNSEIS